MIRLGPPLPVQAGSVPDEASATCRGWLLLIDLIPPLRSSRQPVLQGFLLLREYGLSDRFVLPLFGPIGLHSEASVMIVR